MARTTIASLQTIIASLNEKIETLEGENQALKDMLNSLEAENSKLMEQLNAKPEAKPEYERDRNPERAKQAMKIRAAFDGRVNVWPLVNGAWLLELRSDKSRTTFCESITQVEEALSKYVANKAMSLMKKALGPEPKVALLDSVQESRPAPTPGNDIPFGPEPARQVVNGAQVQDTECPF